MAERGASMGWWFAAPAAMALGAFPALTGHANAGGIRAATVAADTLHVWAAGAWVGGLFLVVYVEGRRNAGDVGSLLPTLVPRFSRVALASVAALVSTGLFASWMHVDGVAGLFGTLYGRILLVKVGLFAVVLALGALNFRRLTPRLGEEIGRHAMRRAAAMEIFFACVVLLVSALLSRTSRG